jgi:hypothetical protein
MAGTGARDQALVCLTALLAASAAHTQVRYNEYGETKFSGAPELTGVLGLTGAPGLDPGASRPNPYDPVPGPYQPAWEPTTPSFQSPSYGLPTYQPQQRSPYGRWRRRLRLVPIGT